MKSWRSRGYRLIPYIDDFVFFCKDRAGFARVQASVLAELSTAGLVVSREKYKLSCSHVAKFLGFVVDALFGQFRLSALQKSKLLCAIDQCLCNPSAVPAKLLARVTGLTTHSPWSSALFPAFSCDFCIAPSISVGPGIAKFLWIPQQFLSFTFGETIWSAFRRATSGGVSRSFV